MENGARRRETSSASRVIDEFHVSFGSEIDWNGLAADNDDDGLL